MVSKEENRSRVRKWREDNPDKYEKHQKYVKEWKLKNADRVIEYNHKWYQKNGKQYYYENRAKILAYQRKRRKEQKK